MSRGTKLSPEHTVTRFVRPEDVHLDDDGIPIGLLPHAFHMRDRDEVKLSVSWQEYYGGSRADNLERSIKAFRPVFVRMPPHELPEGSVFALSAVGSLVSACVALGHTKTLVEHYARPHHPSHARIVGLPKNNITVMQKLAYEVFWHFVLDCDFRDVEPEPVMLPASALALIQPDEQADA